MSGDEVIEVMVDLMQSSDLPQVLDIERVCFPSPWTKRMFEDELASPLSQCLVARLQKGAQRVIGAYIIFWMVADEAHLHNLAVRPDVRKQGMGASLMGLMKDVAQSVGIRKWTLEVRESNLPAIALYRKCGFVVRGRRPAYYSETHEDALIMWAGDQQENVNV